MDALDRLRTISGTTLGEVELACQIFYTFKIANSDTNLVKSLDGKQAGHTFIVIQISLIRDLALAVFRLWDHNGKRNLSLIFARNVLHRAAPALVKMAETQAELETSPYDAYQELGTQTSSECASAEIQRLSTTRAQREKEISQCAEKRKRISADDFCKMINRAIEDTRFQEALKRLRYSRNSGLAHREVFRHQDSPHGKHARIADVVLVLAVSRRAVRLLQGVTHGIGTGRHRERERSVRARYTRAAIEFWSRVKGRR